MFSTLIVNYNDLCCEEGFQVDLFVYSHHSATTTSFNSHYLFILEQQTKDNKSTGSMDINATFADLSAPELEWEEMAEAPVPRLDGAAIQIKNLLYVFAGYGTINYVRKLV